MTNQVTIIEGDITKQNVDAIVNAANSALAGGGGVDGAIHRAAGPELLAYCLTLGACPTGQAKITPGFNLPARYVIHAVGPVWFGGYRNELELLTSCYQESLKLAVEHEVSSIAFPAISTGAYGFPLHLAAPIALATIYQFLQETGADLQVTCVCFGKKSYRAYLKAEADRKD